MSYIDDFDYIDDDGNWDEDYEDYDDEEVEEIDLNLIDKLYENQQQ